ncbi:MAG: hypothetical protein HY316_08565 [Acidobacteria bacterium]|nr:hypothetical protein [Acidobacteriota bacterium]
MKRKTATRFVLCVRNDGCDDLEPRKVYQVIEDAGALAEGYLRIVDDSGEDYLYPTNFFVAIELPKDAAKALAVPA